MGGGVYCSLVVDPNDYVGNRGVIPSRFSSGYAPANKTIIPQLLLVTWTHILTTLTVMIHPLLCIPSKSFLMITDIISIQYRSLLGLPPWLCIPLTSLLTLLDPPFLQYTPLTGLPLIVVNSTIDPLQNVRIMCMPSCYKWLMLN